MLVRVISMTLGDSSIFDCITTETLVV